MITVGVYVHWAGIGGAEDMVIDQIKYSDKEKYRFVFVTEDQAPWCATHDELSSLESTKVYRTNGQTGSYRQIFADENVDIVHVLSCGDVQNGFQAALDMGIPVVDVQACVSYSAGFERYGIEKVQPVYLCHKHWEHGGGGKPYFRTIVGGVDVLNLTDPKEMSATESSSKEYWGLDSNRKVVGWFGRFDQFKCPMSFPIIAELISKSYPDCQFIMFGDGVDKGRTQHIADELKVDIKFVGYTREKAKAFDCMDVFVFPTWQEAFGRVMAEAMAIGVPIVTSDYPVCHELCDKAAAYVTNGREDPLPLSICREYAEATIAILRNDIFRAEMSVFGQRQAFEFYNAARMAREYEALYVEMLSKRK